MMPYSGIETYQLLRLDEVALAGYFDLEDTRFDRWYEKNRAVGDKLYRAILDKELDLVAFCALENGRFYSILTRSSKKNGALQLTDIDRKGPIGHRRLTAPKQLELPGNGATIAAVSDISRCSEKEILDAVGFDMKPRLKCKAAKCQNRSQQLNGDRERVDMPWKEKKSPAR